MALATTARFLNAQQADSNIPVAKVQMVLGNYFSTPAYGAVASSSGDASIDYPAAGAIDGDRTEINEGPASGADNDIGHSTWVSSTVPTSGSPVTLTVTLPASRTINRIKLYCPEFPGSSGPHSYSLSYWNGSAFVVFAATADRVIAGQTSITSTLKLDIVDFPDVTSTIFKLTVYDAQTQACHVVEMEAYRLIDITSRVKGVSVSRQRDYKLANPMAAQASVSLINDDRFFSLNHQPTTAEVAAGFVNSELRPDMGLIVNYGFMYYGAIPELVPSFIGSVDRLAIDPSKREATMQARDGMKALVNQIDSTKLRSGQDITSNIRYVLNRTNISDYEMVLDTTGIVVDYFFTEDTDQLTVIRDLVQAAGDTLFYFDENGIATFKDYSGAIPVTRLFTSETDFETGTIDNISTEGAYVDSLAAPTQFAPTLGSGSFGGDMQIIGGQLSFVGSSPYSGASFQPGGGTLQTMFNPSHGLIQRVVARGYQIPRAGTINTITIGPWTTGAAKITIWADSGGLPNFPAILYQEVNYRSDPVSPVTITVNLHVAAQTIWIGVQNGGSSFTQFQMSPVATHPQEGVYTFNSNTPFALTMADGVTPANLNNSFTFTYDIVSKSGTWTSPVYDSASLSVALSPTLNHPGSYVSPSTATTFIDGGPDGTTWDVTYSVVKLNGNQVFAVANRRFWRIRVSASTSDNIGIFTIGPPSLLFAPFGTWTSPVIDTGTNTINYGSIVQTAFLNTGSINYLTRSSADGISWSPYVATSGGGAVLSPVQRYLQIQCVINLGSPNTTPQILDITVGWVVGAGSLKYPIAPSLVFSFDSTLIDIEQEIADNLSGDTSIINDVNVQAQPLVKTGLNTDTQWQGTIGTPPTNIAVATPLSVSFGDVLTIAPIISGGMDITFMSGANPAAAVVTFAGGATGSWKFVSIHPTRPVLQITVTSNGSITDLRLVGKVFSNASYLQAAVSKDTTSVATYGDRRLTLSNQYIVSTSVAAVIAGQIIINFKDPVSWIPRCLVRPSWSVQIGDRVTVKDINLDLSADYIIVGADHRFSSDLQGGAADTSLTLLKVPAGL